MMVQQRRLFGGSQENVYYLNDASQIYKFRNTQKTRK